MFGIKVREFNGKRHIVLPAKMAHNIWYSFGIIDFILGGAAFLLLCAAIVMSSSKSLIVAGALALSTMLHNFISKKAFDHYIDWYRTIEGAPIRVVETHVVNEYMPGTSWVSRRPFYLPRRQVIYEGHNRLGQVIESPFRSVESTMLDWSPYT